LHVPDHRPPVEEAIGHVFVQQTNHRTAPSRKDDLWRPHHDLAAVTEQQPDGRERSDLEQIDEVVGGKHQVFLSHVIFLLER
jgi:hypothetical protein